MPNNDRLLLPSPPQASLSLERKLAVDPAVLARSGIVSEDELVRTGVKPILVAARASGERTPASLRRGRHAAGVLSRDEAVHPAHRRASPAPASPSVASTSPDPRLPVHLLEDSVPSRPRGLDEDAPRDSRDSSAARESDESRPRSLRGGGREVVGRDRLPSSREMVDAFTARSALETNTVRRLRVRFETNASSNLFPGGGVDDARLPPAPVSLPSARAAESDDARERRVALANFEASRRRDEPDARGRVRRILGRLWKGSALGTFHAWREFARGRRHGRDAAAFAAETLSPILATRPRARTETQLETIRAFLVERDERFADLPRREALDLCRRAREESFEEGDVVRAVGEDDDVVFACVVGAASDWPEEEEERTVATDEENEAGPNIAAKTDANVDPTNEAYEASSANAAPVSAHPVSARDPRAIRTHVPGARCFGEPPSSRAGPRAWTTVADASSRFLILSPEDCSGTSWERPELTRRKRVDFLCRLPCFDACTLAELAAIASHLDPREFEPGAALANQGQECPGVFLILAGEVAVERRVDLDAARAAKAAKAAKAARDDTGEAPKALDAIFRDDAQRDAYFDFVTSRVGAARARGASIRDVRLGVVGPFGVVGGADCLDRSPANCFLVASGPKPVRALHPRTPIFDVRVAAAASAFFRARCAATQTDDAIRETIRARALEASERRRARVEATPEGFRLRRFEPPRAITRRGARSPPRAPRRRSIVGSPIEASPPPPPPPPRTPQTRSWNARTRSRILRRRFRRRLRETSPSPETRTRGGPRARARVVRASFRGRSPRGDWPPRRRGVRLGVRARRRRGVAARSAARRRPAATIAVGGVRVSGGGYAPSSAMARKTKRRVASSNLREALFGVGSELPPPPPRVGVAEARTRAARARGRRATAKIRSVSRRRRRERRGRVGARRPKCWNRNRNRNRGRRRSRGGGATRGGVFRRGDARRSASHRRRITRRERRVTSRATRRRTATTRRRVARVRRVQFETLERGRVARTPPRAVPRRRARAGATREPLERARGRAAERRVRDGAGPATPPGSRRRETRRRGRTRDDVIVRADPWARRRRPIAARVAATPPPTTVFSANVATTSSSRWRDSSRTIAHPGKCATNCAWSRPRRPRRRATDRFDSRGGPGTPCFSARRAKTRTKTSRNPPDGGDARWSLSPRVSAPSSEDGTNTRPNRTRDRPPGDGSTRARMRWTPRGISPWAPPRARRLWTSRRGARSERRTANRETPPRDCATSPRRVEAGARRFDRARRVSQDARPRGWDDGGGVRGVPSRRRLGRGTLRRTLGRVRVRGGKRSRARARVRASRPGTRTIRDEKGDGEEGDGERGDGAGGGGVSTDGARGDGAGGGGVSTDGALRARRRRERGAGDVSTIDAARSESARSARARRRWWSEGSERRRGVARVESKVCRASSSR